MGTPVNPFPERRKLRRRQLRCPVRWRGPSESPALRDLVIEAEPLPIPEQQLIRSPRRPKKANTAPEHGSFRNNPLRKRRQAGDPLAHVRQPQARYTRVPAPGAIMPPPLRGSSDEALRHRSTDPQHPPGRSPISTRPPVGRRTPGLVSAVPLVTNSTGRKQTAAPSFPSATPNCRRQL